MKEYAIIVAGGGGSRMRSNIPKQFLLLAEKPILMHTIEAFREYATDLSIILVLPKNSITSWHQLCEKFLFSYPLCIVEGGKSRFQSVKNGLASIDVEESLVAIHDGVRPLVNPTIINNSFRFAETHGCAVASMPLKESLVSLDQDQVRSIERSKYRSIQTPQTFKTHLIKSAYHHIKEDPKLTDDASVAERYGTAIMLFDGSYENIKVTTPEDLIIAEALLNSKK